MGLVMRHDGVHLDIMGQPDGKVEVRLDGKLLNGVKELRLDMAANEVATVTVTFMPSEMAVCLDGTKVEL